MTALISPPVPDLNTPFWRCDSVNTDTITVQNGVRVNHDLLARVRRARLAIDSVLPSPSAGPQPPARGNR